MATKYWARLIPEDVAKRAQVVFASDYDALAAELAVREQDHELAELQAKSAEQGWNKVRELEAQLERCRAANVYDGNAHRRVSELEAELAEAKTLMRTLCNASDAERESAKFGCRMWLGPETEPSAQKPDLIHYEALGGLTKTMRAFTAFPMDSRMRKMLLDAADRIVSLEAALAERGHLADCVIRVRGNFPCDCGLASILRNTDPPPAETKGDAGG